MRNPAEILGAANRLIKKYNTRDPFRLADELGIMLRYSDSLGSLCSFLTTLLFSFLFDGYCLLKLYGYLYIIL